MKRAVFLLGLLALSICAGVCLWKAVTMPHAIREVEGDIDVSQGPVFELCSEENPIACEKHYIRDDDYVYTLVPVASYNASVVLASKIKHYHTDQLSVLVPVDFCVVWGTIANPEYLQDLRFSQRGRGCRPAFKPGSSVADVIGLHEYTNIHIIPATENVLKALNAIKENQKIVLEGFLVDIYYKGEVLVTTSLSPTDDSCEIVYVTRIRIGNRIYE